MLGLVFLAYAEDRFEAVRGEVEATNPELKDILPRAYQKLERSTLIELLRLSRVVRLRWLARR